MTDRMTLTDIAAHIGCSRPTAYVLVRIVDFPRRGDDRRWDRQAVMEWLANNTVAVDAVSVGGVLVVRA
jgi:predicted DNA-binding transcriptional regulator AlpA